MVSSIHPVTCSRSGGTDLRGLVMFVVDATQAIFHSRHVPVGLSAPRHNGSGEEDGGRTRIVLVTRNSNVSMIYLDYIFI